MRVAAHAWAVSLFILLSNAQTDTQADGAGAKESECGSQELLSPFRHGAAH